MKWLKKTWLVLVISVILFSPLLLIIDFKYVAIVFIVWVFSVIFYVFRIKKGPIDDR